MFITYAKYYFGASFALWITKIANNFHDLLTIWADAWMPSEMQSSFLWLIKLLHYYFRLKYWSACLTSLREYLSLQLIAKREYLVFPHKNYLLLPFLNFVEPLPSIQTQNLKPCPWNPQPGCASSQCDFTALWILQVMSLFFCSDACLPYPTKTPE